MALKLMVKALITFSILVQTGDELIDRPIEGGGLFQIGEMARAGDRDEHCQRAFSRRGADQVGQSA
jgi:hypothetical protein